MFFYAANKRWARSEMSKAIFHRNLPPAIPSETRLDEAILSWLAILMTSTFISFKLSQSYCDVTFCKQNFFYCFWLHAHRVFKVLNCHSFQQAIIVVPVLVHVHVIHCCTIINIYVKYLNSPELIFVCHWCSWNALFYGQYSSFIVHQITCVSMEFWCTISYEYCIIN